MPPQSKHKPKPTQSQTRRSLPPSSLHSHELHRLQSLVSSQTTQLNDLIAENRTLKILQYRQEKAIKQIETRQEDYPKVVDELEEALRCLRVEKEKVVEKLKVEEKNGKAMAEELVREREKGRLLRKVLNEKGMEEVVDFRKKVEREKKEVVVKVKNVSGGNETIPLLAQIDRLKKGQIKVNEEEKHKEEKSESLNKIIPEMSPSKVADIQVNENLKEKDANNLYAEIFDFKKESPQKEAKVNVHETPEKPKPESDGNDLLKEFGFDEIVKKEQKKSKTDKPNEVKKPAEDVLGFLNLKSDEQEKPKSQKQPEESNLANGIREEFDFGSVHQSSVKATAAPLDFLTQGNAKQNPTDNRPALEFLTTDKSEPTKSIKLDFSENMPISKPAAIIPQANNNANEAGKDDPLAFLKSSAPSTQPYVPSFGESRGRRRGA